MGIKILERGGLKHLPSAAVASSSTLSPLVMSFDRAVEGHRAAKRIKRCDYTSSSFESCRVAGQLTSQARAIPMYEGKGKGKAPEEHGPPSPSPTENQPTPVSPVRTQLSMAALAAIEKRMARHRRDLELARVTYNAARKSKGVIEGVSSPGPASFLALDFEFYERNRSAVIEAGWSFVDFGNMVSQEVGDKPGKRRRRLRDGRREVAHVIVKEHVKLRNGRFVPDGKDKFSYGKSVKLSLDSLYAVLDGLFTCLSSQGPLFLVFHDPSGDLKALQELGFDPAMFNHDWATDLFRTTGTSTHDTSSNPTEGKPSDPSNEKRNLFVLDTQSLFMAWSNDHRQTNLGNACKRMGVPTANLHNAGNDSHCTLALFERIMKRSRTP